MKFAGLTIGIIFLLSISTTVSAQSNGESYENWMLGMGLYHEPVQAHRFDLYSKQDIEAFKRRVAEVRKAATVDGWEGNYFREDISSVYFGRLTWSKSAGYFSFGIETCFPELRSIEEGSVTSDSESVRIVSNKPGAAPIRYIKVSWGHRRYLVAEPSLAAFMNKAVGRYVEPENNEDKNYQLWSDYWLTSVKDENPTPDGIPTLPVRYKHLEKAPISAKIAASPKRRIRSDIQHGWTFYTAPSAVYEVIFSSGKKNGLARGMVLIHPTTREKVFITKVTATTAVGELIRAIDEETKLDHCLDEGAEKIACPQLKAGDVYSTPIGAFWDPFL